MIFPLDQPVVLTFDTFSDAAELVPADPTAVSVVILDPAGAQTTYTLAGLEVVRASLGVFTFTYTPAVEGHYAYHWRATGAVTTAQDGSFDVAPLFSSRLVTLDDVKTHLGIDNEDDDDELTAFIERATPLIETMVGPIERRTVTNEQHSPGGYRIALIERPVLSVTTVTEFVGHTSRTITIAASPTATSAYSATLDADKGVLTRWASGSLVPWTHDVWVTYITGRDLPPANVQLATLELIRHLWQTQRGGATGTPLSPDIDASVYVAGYAIPPRVVELLGEDARLDGFA